MTLKSNKNEPALILDSVNSVRTALSDLYLEQLLQNKPTDKVTPIFLWFNLMCFFPVEDFREHVCFREAEKGHMTTVCFPLSKNRIVTS